MAGMPGVAYSLHFNELMAVFPRNLCPGLLCKRPDTINGNQPGVIVKTKTGHLCISAFVNVNLCQFLFPLQKCD